MRQIVLMIVGELLYGKDRFTPQLQLVRGIIKEKTVLKLSSFCLPELIFCANRKQLTMGFILQRILPTHFQMKITFCLHLIFMTLRHDYIQIKIIVVILLF